MTPTPALVLAYIRKCEAVRMAKKKRPSKRGRPPLAEGLGKDSVLTVRIQPAERVAIDHAVASSGKSLSDWIRSALMAAATSVNMES